MTLGVYPVGWPIESDWTSRLDSQFQNQEFHNLHEFVERERQTQTIYPATEHVYTAFRLTSFAETNVVILGQDPYHGPGQAHGLSFSIQNDERIPPSLKNIYRELSEDLPGSSPASGDLTAWAQQGVFLLNTVLTVRSGQANSHRKHGWEQFTDEVIAQLNARTQGVVFILWGNSAIKKSELITGEQHTIISSPHPSPLSAYRGFFGSRPFSQANKALQKLGRSQIEWHA